MSPLVDFLSEIESPLLRILTFVYYYCPGAALTSLSGLEFTTPHSPVDCSSTALGHPR